MKKMINLDIMVDGRYYHTLHLPVETEMVWIGDNIADAINLDSVKDVVMSKFPSLKGKNYNLCLV